MSGVLQSGIVTPTHLCAWTTDGVIQDAGVTFSNSFGQLVSIGTSINFNSANTDNPIPINLPIGYTRYLMNFVLISGASATLTTATCGLFTGENGTGVAIVNGGSAITVSQTTSDTLNNAQALTLNNTNFISYVDTVLYFRVQTPQGSPATANLSITYRPLP